MGLVPKILSSGFSDDKTPRYYLERSCLRADTFCVAYQGSPIWYPGLNALVRAARDDVLALYIPTITETTRTVETSQRVCQLWTTKSFLDLLSNLPRRDLTLWRLSNSVLMAMMREGSLLTAISRVKGLSLKIGGHIWDRRSSFENSVEVNGDRYGKEDDVWVQIPEAGQNV